MATSVVRGGKRPRPASIPFRGPARQPTSTSRVAFACHDDGSPAEPDRGITTGGKGKIFTAGFGAGGGGPFHLASALAAEPFGPKRKFCRSAHQKYSVPDFVACRRGGLKGVSREPTWKIEAGAETVEDPGAAGQKALGGLGWRRPGEETAFATSAVTRWYCSRERGTAANCAKFMPIYKWRRREGFEGPASKAGRSKKKNLVTGFPELYQKRRSHGCETVGRKA